MLNEKRVQNVLRVTFSSVIRAQYTNRYNCYYLLNKFYSKAVYRSTLYTTIWMSARVKIKWLALSFYGVSKVEVEVAVAVHARNGARMTADCLTQSILDLQVRTLPLVFHRLIWFQGSKFRIFIKLFWFQYFQNIFHDI
jgi:hypothetical protein